MEYSYKKRNLIVIPVRAGIQEAYNINKFWVPAGACAREDGYDNDLRGFVIDTSGLPFRP